MLKIEENSEVPFFIHPYWRTIVTNGKLALVGEVALYLKHSLKVKKRKTKSFKSFELMQLLLHKNLVTTRIVVIHRPPPSSTNGFTVNLTWFF
jgi:hypothetical protein